jgi:hypothetical protein
MPMRSPYWDYVELEPIRVQIQVDRVDAATLRLHLDEQTAQMRESAKLGRKVFIIIEARDGNRPPPEVRKLQAEWMQQHRELIAATCMGMAFVIESRLVRGALTAIFWVTPSPVPYSVHATLHEALVHARETCTQGGVELPAQAHRPDAAARIESAFGRAMVGRIAL